MKRDISINGSITGLSLMALLLLPGCGILDFIKGKTSGSTEKELVQSTVSSASETVNDGSKVLLSISGKPVITEKAFDEYYEQFVSSNPQLQAMIQFMPNAKKEIFNGMANERILIAWGEKNNIQNNADYQKELAQAMRMIKTNLAAKQFEKDIIGTITVTDKEMKDYYESHKDPELVVSPGGIKAEGKQFATKEQAQALFDKIKDNPKEFKAAAGKEIKEFAPVNKMSFDVDEKVKDSLLAVSSFPKVVMVEASDKKYWVVVALKKEEAQFRSFDEIKDGIKKMIEREKVMKIYAEKIAELKKEYNVVEDISSLEQAAPAGLPMHMFPQGDDQEDSEQNSNGGAVKSL